MSFLSLLFLKVVTETLAHQIIPVAMMVEINAFWLIRSIKYIMLEAKLFRERPVLITEGAGDLLPAFPTQCIKVVSVDHTAYHTLQLLVLYPPNMLYYRRSFVINFWNDDACYYCSFTLMVC